MAGIPADIIFVEDLNQAAQITALIMSGNDNISHFPLLAGFDNYLSADGIQGAADSNLAIGSYGPDSVDGYMQDKGSGNWEVILDASLLIFPIGLRVALNRVCIAGISIVLILYIHSNRFRSPI